MENIKNMNLKTAFGTIEGDRTTLKASGQYNISQSVITRAEVGADGIADDGPSAIVATQEELDKYGANDTPYTGYVTGENTEAPKLNLRFPAEASSTDPYRIALVSAGGGITHDQGEDTMVGVCRTHYNGRPAYVATASLGMLDYGFAKSTVCYDDIMNFENTISAKQASLSTVIARVLPEKGHDLTYGIIHHHGLNTIEISADVMNLRLGSVCAEETITEKNPGLILCASYTLSDDRNVCCVDKEAPHLQTICFGATTERDIPILGCSSVSVSYCSSDERPTQRGHALKKFVVQPITAVTAKTTAYVINAKTYQYFGGQFAMGERKAVLAGGTDRYNQWSTQSFAGFVEKFPIAGMEVSAFYKQQTVTPKGGPITAEAEVVKDVATAYGVSICIPGNDHYESKLSVSNIGHAGLFGRKDDTSSCWNLALRIDITDQHEH